MTDQEIEAAKQAAMRRYIQAYVHVLKGTTKQLSNGLSRVCQAYQKLISKEMESG